MIQDICINKCLLLVRRAFQLPLEAALTKLTSKYGVRRLFFADDQRRTVRGGVVVVVAAAAGVILAQRPPRHAA